MKKRAILAAVVLAAAGITYGMDFGFSVDSDSTFQRMDESEFIQKNTGLVWVAADLGETWEFHGALSGTLSSDDAEPVFYADLRQLSLKGLFETPAAGVSLVSVEAGRFREAEFSGRVLAHTLDGLRLELGLPDSTGRLTVGYTGLINKYYGSVMMSGADAADDADSDIILGPARLVGTLSWEFIELFSRNSLNLAAVLQKDLRSEDTVDTVYAGAGLNGPLGGGAYYDLYGWYGGGDIASFLLGGGLRWYRPDLRHAALGLSFLYAGGDDAGTSIYDGNNKGFLPVAGSAYGLAFAPTASNLAAAELSFSMKPWSREKDSVLESLQTALTATLFFKPVDGPFSEGQVDGSAGSGYLGMEIGGALNYRPFSDLGLGLSLGCFIPARDMFVDDYQDPWLTGKLYLSFSF